MQDKTKRGVGRPRINKPAKGRVGAPKKPMAERIFRLKLTQFKPTVAVSGELIQSKFGGDILTFFAAIETFISDLQKPTL